MANTKVTSRVLANDAVLTANIADDQVTTAKIADDVALGGNPTTTTQSAGNNTTRIATTAFVTTAVANIVDSAPSALDTLNELAAALGDDANFSTTVTNSIATKLPLAGGTLTGGLTGTSATFTDDVAINNSSPELYFGTTGNHYNWRIAAQENVDAALTIDVGSQDTAYGDDTYSSVFTLKNTGNATFAGTISSSDISITSAGASISLIDSDNNPDYQIKNGNGAFRIIDTTNSEDRINIDTSGNVGIGISPTKKLTVFGTGAGEATVQIEGEGGADPYINFLANNTQHWSLGIDDSDSDKFKLSKHSALGTNDYFTVDTSGNVGIGTPSPSNKLHVTGSGSTPFATQRDVNSGGFAMLQGKLGDSASTTAGHVYSALVAGIEDNTNGAEDGYFAIEVSEGGSGDEKLRIKSDGNVGIGETSPTAPLHVTRTTSGYPILKLTQNGANQYNTIYLQNSNSTAATVVMGTGGGSVGNASWANNAVFGTTSDAKVVLLQNDSAAVTVDTDQNILVGTTTSPPANTPKAIKYGVGVQAGSMQTNTVLTAGTAGQVADTSSLISGTAGEGIYLVTIVRHAGSFGQNHVGIYGINSSTVILYATLANNGMTVSVSGTTISCSPSSNDTYMTNIIPLSIDK
jgi:hypothetical protein